MVNIEAGKKSKSQGMLGTVRKPLQYEFWALQKLLKNTLLLFINSSCNDGKAMEVLACCASKQDQH